MSEKHPSRPNQRVPFSRKFRRGMAAGLLTAGATGGALAATVVDNMVEQGKLPACEFNATQYGVNSPSAAMNKLKKAGADTRNMEVHVYAEDGHQRTAFTDPVEKGSVVIQAGDRIEVLRVDPLDCARAAGHVAVDAAPVSPRTEVVAQHDQ